MRPPSPALHPVVGPVLDWYAGNARDLPWRAPDRTAWGVLVSEVMLQQTPVGRVTPIWLAWMERWPTPAALASAAPADVLRAWSGLGYPRRALRLIDCARAIEVQHGGEVPDDEAALLALPGVGEYTAAAVLAFAHGRRSVVLDTNVRRVLGRVLDGRALPPLHLTAAERAQAATVVPDDDETAARWSQAVMELGAVVCVAGTPRCGVCPVEHLCRWRAAGMPVDELAHRRRRQAWVGTDRQARGRVMAALGGADEPLDDGALALVWPDDAQRTRALAGLVADGLVEPVTASPFTTYRLPVARPTAADEPIR